MPMKFAGVELRHLRYFSAVARCLSFTRAALELHVVQPALSRQIKDLENFVGAMLFDRTRSRVKLTAAGETFRTHAEKILMQVDIAISAAREAEKQSPEELIVGNDWRLAHPSVTQAVCHMRERFPRMELTVLDMTMTDQIAALKTGRIHVAFLPQMQGKYLDERFKYLPFASSRMVLVVGATHHLASRERFELETLRDENWLAMDGNDTTGFRGFLLKLCKEFCGFVPRRIQRVRSLESALNLVAVGEGITLLPEHIAINPKLAVRVIPLKGLKAVSISAVYAEDNRPSPLAEFLKILKELGS